MSGLRLSFSAAKAYMDCPRKYQHRLDVDFTDPRIRTVGSLTHAVLERYIILSQEAGYCEANFLIAHDTTVGPDIAPDVSAEVKKLA
ncbi:MAG TPA: PD-(D/E)XK nuclease family protein, partial [Candidatus Hydrogenedentes bacterium]|nr:PD-(D/E)XK nuclease family protein [Candidatus Hydrogenedentota bacterium]